MKNLLLLSLGLTLAACSSTPEPVLEPPSEATTASEMVSYWPSQGQAQITYAVQSEVEPAYSLTYPLIINLGPNHPLKKAVNESYTPGLETFKNEATTFFNDSEAGVTSSASIPWNYHIEWLGGRYAPDLWSLAFQIYTYSGGAHGNHYTDTYNYHPTSNKILTLASLFQDDAYLEPIADSIRASLIKEKTERWEISQQAEDYNAEQDWFLAETEFTPDILESWVVSEREGERGLLFFFAPYAVGAYAEGGYEAFVPVSVFRDDLRREFVGVFE